MFQNHDNFKILLYYILLISLLIMLFFLPGCRLLKDKKTVISSSAAISRADSIQKKTFNSDEYSLQKIVKHTVYFPVKDSDNNIINSFPASTDEYIFTAVKKSKQKIDSNFSTRLDLSQSTFTAIEKKKKETFFSPVQIAGAIAFFILIIIIIFLFKKNPNLLKHG